MFTSTQFVVVGLIDDVLVLGGFIDSFLIQTMPV